MSQAFPKSLVLDVGHSWTKAFLIQNDKNKLLLERYSSVPTTIGDLSIAANTLLKDLKVAKGTNLIVTGALPETETLAKNLSATYTTQEEAESAFRKYLEKNGMKKSVILDTGEYSYANNLKISHIGAFLTFDASENDIENYFGNKSLKPESVPTSPQELEIEEAFYRVAFSQNREFIASPNVVNVIITGALLPLLPKQAKIALIILDILAKGRIAQVKLDSHQFLHGFGALLKTYPEIGEWENDFWQPLGSFVSFGGKGRIMLDYGFTENQELNIVEDEIALIPAPKEQQVEITLLDLKDKPHFSVSGGAFGVLLDGRVKPLKLGFGRADSRDAMKRWLSAIDKVEVIG
ncbi:MAG TPA: hypothetical protein VLE47_04455 [Candidatus Saccharimonadales bacterium]|nr:hypothetical protein [Candidatus Saccharimonadales bacterium]